MALFLAGLRRRWERDTPEVRRACNELNRDHVAFIALNRHSNYAAHLLFLCSIILHLEVCARCKRSRTQQHRAMIIYRNSRGLDIDFMPRYDELNCHRKTDHYAMTAAPFFARRDLLVTLGRTGVAQSSNPQKSIGGCVSSMPTSQPSVRLSPLHTTTPELRSPVIVLRTVIF
jgi:hypothetical protein